MDTGDSVTVISPQFADAIGAKSIPWNELPLSMADGHSNYPDQAVRITLRDPTGVEIEVIAAVIKMNGIPLLIGYAERRFATNDRGGTPSSRAGDRSST